MLPKVSSREKTRLASTNINRVMDLEIGCSASQFWPHGLVSLNYSWYQHLLRTVAHFTVPDSNLVGLLQIEYGNSKVHNQ